MWISWLRFDLSAASKEREKRRAERGWRCRSKAAAAAKADWVQIVEGMIQIWSRDSAPAAYWETRDCMVALTKCGRNGCDALSSDRGSREEKPSRARTVFKVSPYLGTVSSQNYMRIPNWVEEDE